METGGIFPQAAQKTLTSREKTMAARTMPHSIRFTGEEWNGVRAAAERRDMTPGAFVREAAARAAAEDLGFDDGRIAPELIELLKKTFRGVHLLTYLKRQESIGLGREEDFRAAAGNARLAQDETLGAGEPGREM